MEVEARMMEKVPVPSGNGARDFFLGGWLGELRRHFASFRAFWIFLVAWNRE